MKSLRNLADSVSNVLVTGASLAALVIALVCIVNAVRLLGDPFPGFFVNARLLVSDVGLPNWPGMDAGLHYPDRVMAVDNEAVESLEQIKQLVSNKSAGEEVGYRISRHGDEFDITVPAKIFSPKDLFATGGITFLTGLIYLLIGILVYIMKPGQDAARAFFIACLSLGLYTIIIFDINWPDAGFIRLYLFLAALFPAAFIHLALYFPEPRKIVVKNPFIGLLPYGISVLLGGTAASAYPEDLFFTAWQGITVFMALSAVFVVVSILLSYLWTASQLAKQRARVVLFGAALAFPIPTFVYGSQLLFEKLMTIPANLVMLPALIFPASIAYAISRHNLFDVDAYIKRTVGYLLMTAILASGYLGLQSAVRYLLVEPVFGEVAEGIYPILYAVLVVFLFNPINTRIQRVIDRLFYRKVFDFKEVVQGVERALTSVLDINDRMHRLVNGLKETLFLDTVGLVVFAGGDAAGNTYFESDAEETGEAFITRDMRIERSNALVNLVMREERLITRFDIEEDKRYSANRDVLLRQFDNLDASICLPLTHNDETFGVVFLGNKKSGRFFNKQDIDLVKLVTARGAVAIDNANLVEQMKKEEEVRGNLARYLSPEIVERVVSDDMQVNLGGQRKVVSVLFSDIRGFTTISEAWPPDQLVTILNEYMTEMVAVVFENRGSIDKFVGDAIVAVFGSLVEVENHAQQAVQAALGMRRRLVDLNKKWHQEYGIELGIGVGINTGEVFLGNIGSPDRMEFTVIGDAVNLAARLEGLTKYYEVGLIVSEFTRKSLTDMLCRKLDLVQVKGKKEAVAIYEPVCATLDADDALREELLRYDQALAAYYQQDWDNAGGIFNVLQNHNPDRHIYTMYMERIDNLRSAGLPADWDGVFVHTEK